VPMELCLPLMSWTPEQSWDPSQGPLSWVISVLGVSGVGNEESMVQVGSGCSTKVQAALTLAGGCQRVSSRPDSRARYSFWKPVSLSIQSTTGTIPNPYFTYQNLLIDDRVLRFAWRRNGENQHGVHSSYGIGLLVGAPVRKA
jgi:hypothetical protein